MRAYLDRAESGETSSTSTDNGALDLDTLPSHRFSIWVRSPADDDKYTRLDGGASLNSIIGGGGKATPNKNPLQLFFMVDEGGKSESSKWLEWLFVTGSSEEHSYTCVRVFEIWKWISYVLSRRKIAFWKIVKVNA